MSTRKHQYNPLACDHLNLQGVSVPIGQLSRVSRGKAMGATDTIGSSHCRRCGCTAVGRIVVAAQQSGLPPGASAAA